MSATNPRERDDDGRYVVKNIKVQLFFELLRISLGASEFLGCTPSQEEWAEIIAISRKQAVDGVLLVGVNRLPANQKPPQILLLQWIGVVESIKIRNRLLNMRTTEVTRLFSVAGFRSCILKGQGNALLYPDPFTRMPGDIDIWVDGNRKDIRNIVLETCPNAYDGDMHIDFPYFKDVVVEVHYKPHYSSIPKYDKRLQAWFKEKSNAQFANQVTLPGEQPNRICVPTTCFNIVHQMSHIMGHFFVEGVGLRQFIDYFYLLKKLHEEDCQTDWENLYKYLGLLKFARGVMWIEYKYLGIEKDFLLVEPDERIGEVIMTEVLAGGNFGRYDDRYSTRRMGMLARGLTDVYRLFILALYFPKESIWKTIKKIGNQKWKLERALRIVKG